MANKIGNGAATNGAVRSEQSTGVAQAIFLFSFLPNFYRILCEVNLPLN